MKSKVYHNYWSVDTFILILIIIVMSFISKGFSILDFVKFFFFNIGLLIIFVFIELLDTHGGLFTDTVYVDEEKIVIDKKNFQKTIYWNQVMEIQQLNTRIGKEYCVERFGSTRKEQELTRFSCSNKFKEYMYAMFEQAKTNMRDSLQQQ